VLRITAVLFLAAALACDIAGAGHRASDVLMTAGLALLLAAVIFPSDTAGRRTVSLHAHIPHPHIAHRREHGPVTVASVRPSGNPVTRFNTRAAVIITRAVGSMWAAYAFCVLAFYGLPAGLHGGAAGFVQWASSQFIQLVLLPIILVGSAVLADASDKMARRQFDDVEAILHGQGEQAAHLAAQDDKILAILVQIQANTTLTEEVRAAIVRAASPPTVMTPAVKAGPPGSAGTSRGKGATS
jgi:hypothetical protein